MTSSWLSVVEMTIHQVSTPTLSPRCHSHLDTGIMIPILQGIFLLRVMKGMTGKSRTISKVKLPLDVRDPYSYFKIISQDLSASQRG